MFHCVGLFVYFVYDFNNNNDNNNASGLALCMPGAWFTKYLTTILRLSYDNAKVTINLRRMSNLQNIWQWMESYS